MKRRKFITLLSGAVAWPFAAQAQSERIRRVGVLMAHAESEPEGQAPVRASREPCPAVRASAGRRRLAAAGRRRRPARRPPSALNEVVCLKARESASARSSLRWGKTL
jgi:hypothetical protein